MKISNSPHMLSIFREIISHPSYADQVRQCKISTFDTNLAWLTYGAAAIVDDSSRPTVFCAGFFAIAWLESLPMERGAILIRIADERLRQRRLFAERKHRYTVCSPVVSWTRKLRTLVEEIGEVAEAIDAVEAHPQSRKAIAHFVEELVHVAAVCMAWLESFEGRAPKPGDGEMALFNGKLIAVLGTVGGTPEESRQTGRNIEAFLQQSTNPSIQ